MAAMVAQEHPHGSGVACIAHLFNTSYANVWGQLTEDERFNASYVGFTSEQLTSIVNRLKPNLAQWKYVWQRFISDDYGCTFTVPSMIRLRDSRFFIRGNDAKCWHSPWLNYPRMMPSIQSGVLHVDACEIKEILIPVKDADDQLLFHLHAVCPGLPSDILRLFIGYVTPYSLLWMRIDQLLPPIRDWCNTFKYRYESSCDNVWRCSANVAFSSNSAARDPHRILRPTKWIRRLDECMCGYGTVFSAIRQPLDLSLLKQLVSSTDDLNNLYFAMSRRDKANSRQAQNLHFTFTILCPTSHARLDLTLIACCRFDESD
jgi:hypothetical protein